MVAVVTYTRVYFVICIMFFMDRTIFTRQLSEWCLTSIYSRFFYIAWELYESIFLILSTYFELQYLLLDIYVELLPRFPLRNRFKGGWHLILEDYALLQVEVSIANKLCFNILEFYLIDIFRRIYFYMYTWLIWWHNRDTVIYIFWQYYFTNILPYDYHIWIILSNRELVRFQYIFMRRYWAYLIFNFYTNS